MRSKSCKLRLLHTLLSAGTNRSSLLLDAAYKFIFCILALPLLSYGYNFVIRSWGKSYITPQNLGSFLSYPLTILLILLFLIGLSYTIFFETTTLIYHGSIQATRHRLNPLELMDIGLNKSLRSIFSGNLMLPFYALLLFLFSSTSILIGIVIYIPMNVAKGSSDEVFIKGLIILGILFLDLIAFFGVFSIHYSTLAHEKMGNAFRMSKGLLKGRCKKTAGFLLLYNLILTISFYLIYYIVLFIAALFVYLLSEKSVVISAFLSVYPKINFGLILFFSMVAFTTNINLITYLFHQYGTVALDSLRQSEVPDSKSPTENRSPRRNPIYIGIFILLLGVGLFNFYLSVRNDTLILKDNLFGTLICSHRGNSHVAPENTIPALENAILALSDYAEIDVQQTKDGILVLYHDNNLKRTTGLNKNLWELTYDQLSSLDAGRWFGPEFIDTPIPTLEEALIYCKGKIELNIEIKANKHNHNLEERLVALIEEYDYEHQCVVSSWDEDVLFRIKELNPQIKTGYIVNVLYGDAYTKDYIDFFSIRSNFISKYLVDKAHRLGKEVHAWTANSSNEIEHLKSLGVDCIITDNPTLAREIIYRNDSNKSFIELLNRMLYNRSFYKLKIPG